MPNAAQGARWSEVNLANQRALGDVVRGGMRWKGSVGGKKVYAPKCRGAKMEIPAET
jgi:hypothetical protein